jgi:hypothetical protein
LQVKTLPSALGLEELRRQIAGLEGPRREAGTRAIGSGCDALDELLPEKGFRPGTLTEWLSAGEGGGAGTLALLAARQACRDGGALVVLDGRGDFCPPAAVRLGIESPRLVVIHPPSAADHHWAMNQALRSSAIAAVLAWPKAIDDRTFRRWQLAVEEGGGLGLLVRPEAARAEPSWADVRLLVEPKRGGFSRQWRITVLRCRGGVADRGVDLELDDETYCVHSVARLAAPTARHRLASA